METTPDSPADLPAKRVWKAGESVTEWSPVPGRLPLRSIHACERQEWSLLLWPRDTLQWEKEQFRPRERKDGAAPQRVPFYCGSWRCRRCARWRGALDFTRCKAGLEGKSWWLYIVLGCDVKEWETPWEAFTTAGVRWDKQLRRRFERACGGKLEYLQTWEAFTKTRFPHANLLLGGPELRAWVESLGGIKSVHRTSEHTGRARWHTIPTGFRRWLRKASPECGFGRVVWCEIFTVDNPEALAGYLVKLAQELTGASIGQAKGNQSPIDAPPHFRRIRASRGLLPPLDKEGHYTGLMEKVQYTWDPMPPRKPGRKKDGQSRAATWGEVLRAYAENMARIAGQPYTWGYYALGLHPLTGALVDAPSGDEANREASPPAPAPSEQE